MTVDEAMAKALAPVFGKDRVYNNVTPEILERDLERNFKPFVIFKCHGGTHHATLHRMNDLGKDNYDVLVEVWGTRIGEVRKLAQNARLALLQSGDFLAVHRYGGMVDHVEFGNKLFGTSQDFSLWVSNS